MTDINEILAEREKTHGDYHKQAFSAQELKSIMRSMPNWCDMDLPIKEALEMIGTKIARMGHGEWKDKQHAEDISGYAMLVVRELEK